MGYKRVTRFNKHRLPLNLGWGWGRRFVVSSLVALVVSLAQPGRVSHCRVFRFLLRETAALQFPQYLTLRRKKVPKYVPFLGWPFLRFLMRFFRFRGPVYFRFQTGL